MTTGHGDPGVSREIAIRLNNMLAEIEGYARQTQWETEDGWLVCYTTERIKGGRPQLRGRFATMAYKPVGRGARTDPQSWKRVYMRAFSKRRLARARAIAIYAQHSPKYRARQAGRIAPDGSEL